MTEYEHEPIPGLPGIPPPGEQILWQGSPDWHVLARTAFHTRFVTGYFILLTAWALIGAVGQGVRAPGDLAGVALTIVGGTIGVAAASVGWSCQYSVRKTCRSGSLTSSRYEAPGGTESWYVPSWSVHRLSTNSPWSS